MRFCTNCGAQIQDGVKFCTECGQKVDASPQSPREETVQSYPPPAPQSDKAPARTGSSDSCTAPAQVENSGAYVPPSPPPKASKQKKPGGVRKVALFAVIGVLVLAALFAIFGGTGGSKADDPNLGRYEGVSCVIMGMCLGVEDQWIE